MQEHESRFKRRLLARLALWVLAFSYLFSTSGLASGHIDEPQAFCNKQVIAAIESNYSGEYSQPVLFKLTANGVKEQHPLDAFPEMIGQVEELALGPGCSLLLAFTAEENPNSQVLKLDNYGLQLVLTQEQIKLALLTDRPIDLNKYQEKRFLPEDQSAWEEGILPYQINDIGYSQNQSAFYFSANFIGEPSRIFLVDNNSKKILPQGPGQQFDVDKYGLYFTTVSGILAYKDYSTGLTLPQGDTPRLEGSDPEISADGKFLFINPDEQGRPAVYQTDIFFTKDIKLLNTEYVEDIAYGPLGLVISRSGNLYLYTPTHFDQTDPQIKRITLELESRYSHPVTQNP